MFLINAEHFICFFPRNPIVTPKPIFTGKKTLLFTARYVQPQIKSTWSAASRLRFASRFHARGMIPVSLAGRQHVRAAQPLSLDHAFWIRILRLMAGNYWRLFFFCCSVGTVPLFFLKRTVFSPPHDNPKPPPASFLVTLAKRWRCCETGASKDKDW